MELFDNKEFTKDWIVPDEPYIPEEMWNRAKVVEMHIPPYTGKKTRNYGPVAKQSTKMAYFHRKDGSLVTFRFKGSNKEMPQSFNYTPEPANSATIEYKRFVRDVTGFLDVNNAYFKRWIVIEKMVFIYPPISSLKKGTKELIGKGETIPKITHPDIDNLQKLLYDVFGNLNTDTKKHDPKIRFIQNDGMIFWVKNMYKCYGKKPGTYIKLRGE